MLEHREKLHNQIADAFDPEKEKNREERMELLLSALFELNETTKEEFNDAYKKEVDAAIKEEVEEAVSEAIKIKEAGDNPSLDEKEKAAIRLKKRTEALRNKEGQVTEKLNQMIKKTADTENEDIIAARGMLTAIMREPESYGLSSKMMPLLVKLYGDISIVPKYKATLEETESSA